MLWRLFNLTDLKIGLRHPLQKLTMQCLYSLGRHCPRLEECGVLDDFDLASAKLDLSLSGF